MSQLPASAGSVTRVRDVECYLSMRPHVATLPGQSDKGGGSQLLFFLVPYAGGFSICPVKERWGYVCIQF